MMYDRLATFAQGFDLGALSTTTKVVGDVIDLQGGRYSRQGSSLAQRTDLGDGMTVHWFLEAPDWPSNNNSAGAIFFTLTTDDNVALNTATRNILIEKRIVTAANTPPSDVRGTFIVPAGEVYRRYLGVTAFATANWAATETGNVNSWVMAAPHTSQIIYEEARNWF